jgi:hypothetical protein
MALSVEALRYKSQVRGFHFQSDHWIFHELNPFGHTEALGSTQPLTEMNTSGVSCELKADRT